MTAAIRAARLVVRRFGAARTSEDGAVLVLFALASVALLGAVGLAVDGSRMMHERRQAQAAVDHAATAAAFFRCGGSTDAAAVAAGKAAAKTNGFDDALPNVVVDVTPVAPTAPAVDPDPYDFRAVVTSTINSTFARVLGFSSFNISAEASAGGSGCGSTGGGPGAVYGGGTCEAGKGVEFSGSDLTVIGKVHANADLKISGSDSDFDEVTYVDAANVSGSNITYAPSPPTWPQDVGPSLPVPQWAAGFSPTDANNLLSTYRTLGQLNSRYTAAGGTPPKTINKGGVWFSDSTNEWVIESVTTADPMTIVTRGPIKVSTSGLTMNAMLDGVPRRGLLMLSTFAFSSEADKCSKYGVQIAGQNFTYTGILWSTGGLVEFNGSDNATGRGAIVGWGIKTSGQNIRLEFDASLFPGNAQVFLAH